MTSDRPLVSLPASCGSVHESMLEDWNTVADALLKQADESLSDAAQRCLRRSKRLNIVTHRTHVAGIVMGGMRHAETDPWPRIRRAAAVWRNR